MRNEKIFELLGLLILIFLAWLLVKKIVAFFKWLFGAVTIYSWQRGLLYKNGKLERVLEPGRHFMFKPWSKVELMDMRQSVVNIVNQEIICADNLPIRLSSSVVYKIKNPVMANEQAKNFTELLYLDVQLAMREAVAGLKIEELLQQRNEISEKVCQLLQPRAEAFGLSIERGGIRDITFPGDVKKIYAQIAEAEKSAQATLVKSRAETASLRALANAARMMDSNPNLLHLRTLQAITEVASTAGNTIMFGVPANIVPVPTLKEAPADSAAGDAAE